MDRVLISGADGQLGRALHGGVPEGVQALSANRLALDISNELAVRRWCEEHSPTAIINAAAYTAVDKAESDSELATKVNVDGARNLARVACERQIPILQVSTDFVFNGRKGSPYLATDTADPLNVYGATKLAGEFAVIEEAGELAAILRTAWVYGETGNNFVLSMLRLMAERESLSVVSDQIGSPTNVTGLAGACWSMFTAEVRGVHHWTDAGVASWYDFAHAIQQEALALELLSTEIPILPIPAAEYPTPAVRPAMSVLDKTATWQALQWSPVHWQLELKSVLTKLKNSQIAV